VAQSSSKSNNYDLSDLGATHYDLSDLGAVAASASKPAAQASYVQKLIPPSATIRPPLTFAEYLRNTGRDVVNALPFIGTVAGGTLFGVPGAGVGAMAGQTSKNLAHALGVGDEPPPATAMGELTDVGAAGLKGAGEQLIGQALHGAVTAPMEPPRFPLPRADVHPSVRDLTDALGKTNNIHVEDTFRNSVSKAMDALKITERDMATRARDIRDLRVIADEASKNAWKPYQSLLEYSGTPITRDELLAEADRLYPQTLKDTKATAYDATKAKWAADLSKPEFTWQDVENAAQADNVRLKSVYQKDNIDRVAALKMPEHAGDEAMLQARRNLLDARIKAETGYDPAELRQNYGHIKAVHNASIKSPSSDDTLFQDFKRNIPVSKTEAGGRVIGRFTQSSPDQLVRRAFKRWPEPKPSTGLVPSGWETPTEPETSGPDIGQGANIRPTPPPKKLYSETIQARPPAREMPAPPAPPPKQLGTGQKLLPKDTGQQDTGQRGSGPRTAEEYLRSKVKNREA
jgi:hypothetical protein